MWGDYKPDIAQMGMTNIFHDFNTHLNEATNHKVHISNHGGPITFIALSAALKGALASSWHIYYVYNVYITQL